MPDIFTASKKEAETNSQPMTESLDDRPLVDHQAKIIRKEKIRRKYHLDQTLDQSSSAGHRHVDDYSEVMKRKAPNANPLSSFLAKPFRVGFSTQASGETVILLLRQHPITQVGWLILAIILAFVPVFFDSFNFFAFFPVRYQLAIYFGWYLILLGFIFESFLKWFYNVYLITDERIIDIDFYSLTYRNISAAKIDNIEDTTASTAGFLSALLDFGTVTVQTAAEKREFEFDGVPHPAEVTTLINELILEEEREKIEGRTN